MLVVTDNQGQWFWLAFGILSQAEEEGLRSSQRSSWVWRREYCACNSCATCIAMGERVSPRTCPDEQGIMKLWSITDEYLHPEWVPSPTKIRKWALSLLSFVPLKPKDQSRCGALVYKYLSHNTWPHVIFSATLKGSLVIILFDWWGNQDPGGSMTIQSCTVTGQWGRNADHGRGQCVIYCSPSNQGSCQLAS